MLEVYHSNRLEVLIGRLAEVTGVPLSDPFRPEAIVVQNQGMARWVAQQMAQREGICANLEFPFPASFFWQVLKAWIPNVPDQELFDKDALLWRVMRLLPSLLGQPAFAPLQRYLAAGTSNTANVSNTSQNSDLRLFQLARRIADLFDQYLVYRPDQVLSWEAEREEHWQALLWRALCAEGEADGKNAHRARLLADLEQAMATSDPAQGALPERVSLFGLTALAPVYMGILDALARHIAVHVFYLNPCREYWTDLVDERGQARRRARAQRAGLPDPTGLLDVGNPLLASLGHAGQVFLDQLLELGGVDHDLFAAPEGDTLLQQVQRDILELNDPHRHSEPGVVSLDDLSIQVHSAHSPLREVQILHDRLLRLFERLDGLEPRTVIVMAPDIDIYAPYVEAVFGAAARGMRIPWSIADRRAGAEHPLLEAVDRLLALPRCRFEVTEILALLEVPSVQRRFGLDAAGLERVRTWVRESGVRWGEDAAMRADLGLPEEKANTWAFGLDRLFLGYALPPDPDADPYAGVLPYVDLEGGEVVSLGALQSVIEVLGTWRRRLAAPRTVADWRTTLNAMLADVFAPDEDEGPVVQRVRDRLDDLVTLADKTGFERPLSLDVIHALLQTLFEDTQGAQRFLTGRVTFCNMVPMRSIPFRVVCLIGMNGTDFPRSQHPLSFDLISQAPRRGDRSRRRDDRYLFLEALLSARDALYLSYIGNDVRDSSVKVPSVVVSELLDCLGQGYRLPDGGDLAEHLLVRHPLQPFSRTYFDGEDERLFSYARLWLDAARTEAADLPSPFADTGLAPPDEAHKILDIEELIRFLRNPCLYFLTQRLGLRLVELEDLPDDTEPFEATGLERYQMRQSLLRQLLEGCDEPAILARLRGEGVLPHGAPGELLLEDELSVARPFVQRLEKRAGEVLEPLEVDLPLAGYRLQGQLGNLLAGGRVDYRFGKLRAKDRLAAWVRHLVLNTLAPEGIAPVSLFLAEDYTLHLEPVAAASDLLADLLELRWQGLCAPLPFYPESALAWVQKQKYGSTFDHAWSGAFNAAPEGNDLAVRIAFRGRDPLGVAFEALARRILQPLLDFAETVKAEKDST